MTTNEEKNIVEQKEQSQKGKQKEEKLDKTVLFKHTYGLYIVSSTSPEGSAACVINTATQVTSDPVRITIAVNNDNQTCNIIKQSGHFALSILDQSADMLFIGRFGFRSSRDFDKFEGIKTATDSLGNIYTPEHSCGLLDCVVEETIPCGTHTIFLAQVVAAKSLSSEKPLTYEYYHTVLKGKTPPKASSYAGD